MNSDPRERFRASGMCQPAVPYDTYDASQPDDRHRIDG